MNEKENKPILLSSRRTILQTTSVIGFSSAGLVAPVTAQSADSIDVEFDGLNDSGELEVKQESAVDVTGSTTADPDSDAVLRLRSSDSNTLISEADVTVSESGEFESTVDFSEFNSGRELTLQFVVDSEPINSVTAIVTVELTVTFDDLNEDGELEVKQESAVDVTGSTTVDSDSDAVLRLRSSDSNTLISEADVTVSESGEFESTVDFSEFNSGRELTLQFVVDSEPINSVTAIVTAEPTITFDKVNDYPLSFRNGKLEVPRDDVHITGTTTADTSADAQLRFVSTDAANEFRMAEEISGEFLASPDFSDKEVGDEFEIRFWVDGHEVRVVDSVVVRQRISVSYDQDRAGANRPTEIEVYPTAEFEISGRAYNTYPDDEAVLRFASTDADNEFRIQESVNLSTDGEFSTTVDFSDLEAGDEFTTYFRVNGERVDESDSFVVEPPESESEDQQSDETNTEESTTEETDSDSDTDDETDTETKEETEQQGEQTDETNGEESTTEETDSDSDTEDEPSTEDAVDVVLDELGDIVAEWLS
jgi:hypothetical protein